MNSTFFKKGWDRFIRYCTNISSDDMTSQFMDLILSSEERDSIAMRILLVEELLKGRKTQREIAESLGISISKITRGSNNLKLISKDLKDLLKKQID